MCCSNVSSVHDRRVQEARCCPDDGHRARPAAPERTCPYARPPSDQARRAWLRRSSGRQGRRDQAPSWCGDPTRQPCHPSRWDGGRVRGRAGSHRAPRHQGHDRVRGPAMAGTPADNGPGSGQARPRARAGGGNPETGQGWWAPLVELTWGGTNGGLHERARGGRTTGQGPTSSQAPTLAGRDATGSPAACLLRTSRREETAQAARRPTPTAETGPTAPGVHMRLAAAGSLGSLSATGAGARASEGRTHPTQEAA
jgi:hypothetical protein